MNNFANTIFTVLFGWVRSLVQGIWNAVVQGDLSRFFTWLGDHWLGVLLFLCLCCTVLDYLVWLLRWRPYLVWRTRMRRLIQRLRGRDEQFHQGYEEGVALEFEEEGAPAPAWEEAQEWQQPMAPAWQDEAPVQNAYAREQMSASRRYFPQPESYEPPPVYTPSRQEAAFSSDMPAARRKRRSEKYEHKKPRPWEMLTVSREDEEEMLDGLPPAVDPEQAFHQPVYPQRDTQPYSAWKRPDQ
ncbi:MAG: hypothetical protein E7329_08715 [Clostridiales bacterium]|nr:hypothetical protein [Clostridiales bacterium]